MARATSKKERGVVIGLIRDVFFGITVRNTIRRLNFEAQIIKSVDELPSAIRIRRFFERARKRCARPIASSYAFIRRSRMQAAKVSASEPG